MRNFFFILFACFILLASLIAFQFYRWQAPSVVQDTTVIIPPGAGSRAMIAQLQQANVLPGLWAMALPLYLEKRDHFWKAGEYAFAVGQTPEQMFDKIARGQIVIHKVTIPEGWNSWQVRAALMAEPLLTGDLPAIAEGSIFPQTYRFQRGQPRINVLQEMQRMASDTLNKLWAARDPASPLASPQQALILASIIEKETSVREERPMVAAVFYHRLRIGMKLQTDPTVIYGIEAAQNGAPMGRELTTADLQRDSYYNSYTRDGLPPTPICNPSISAIEAALHPAQTQALYFVATGHGGHYFADTLAQHAANVLQYKAVRPAPRR